MKSQLEVNKETRQQGHFNIPQISQLGLVKYSN